MICESENRCVICGTIIPEGRMVCGRCEKCRESGKDCKGCIGASMNDCEKCWEDDLK